MHELDKTGLEAAGMRWCESNRADPSASIEIEDCDAAEEAA